MPNAARTLPCPRCGARGCHLCARTGRVTPTAAALWQHFFRGHRGIFDDEDTMQFGFAIQADESVFDRWIRFYETLLAGGPISLEEHPDTLRAFLDVVSTPGQPVAFIDGHAVDDESRWKTNCAMTAHAAQVWCGRVLRPGLNGESIEQWVELRRGDARWVKNDGSAKPKGPAIFYVGASSELPYDHVGAFGRELAAAPRSFVSYEGGGGDGTRIAKSMRALDRADSYGRRIEGWWEIGDLLPPSPEQAPGPDGVVPLGTSQAIEQEAIADAGASGSAS